MLNAFKPDYEPKIKVYYTDHWILSSFFCIQGNHSDMADITQIRHIFQKQLVLKHS